MVLSVSKTKGFFHKAIAKLFFRKLFLPLLLRFNLALGEEILELCSSLLLFLVASMAAQLSS